MRAGPMAAVLVAVLCCVATPSSALKPEIGYRARPADYGLICESIEIRTSDALSLRGWFYPAQTADGVAVDSVGRLIPMPEALRPPARAYRAADEPKPTLVLCNGDAGNMTFLILYAYQFCTRGYNVLTFDWRGFGESDSWPTDPDRLAYTEYLLDYAAAIDAAKARPETDPDRIGLFGFSTGAYLSFALAAQRDDVSALVCRGTPTSFDDALPLLKELAPERDLRAPEDYPLELLPAVAAVSLRTPTLLIVGEQDVRTPPWMSERIFERLAGPRELWIVPGAQHGGGDAPEYVDYPAFFERAAAFYDRHLAGRD